MVTVMFNNDGCLMSLREGGVVIGYGKELR
jgi:hypothetical protein